MSPSARGADLERRTVKALEAAGYKAERVSRGGRFGGGDCLGVIDLIAVGRGEIILGQVTTRTNASARRRKIREADLGVPVHLFMWFQLPNRRWSFLSEVVMPQ